MLIGLSIVIATGLAARWWLTSRSYEALSPVEKGREIVENGPCRACHSRDSSFRAPYLEGLWNKTRTFKDHSQAVADDAYLEESITAPAKRIVEGYGKTMPSYKSSYSKQELRGIVEYLRTLKRLH